MEAGSGSGATPEGKEQGGITDQLQKAIDDLTAAGQKATGDVRSNIEDAVKRIRSASGDAASQAGDQAQQWQKTLENAADDARRQLGKLGIRAQGSTEALDELQQELDSRRAALGGTAEGGSSA